MGSPNNIACSTFIDSLVTQTPFFDTEIVKDIRPIRAGMMGFYQTAPYKAYTDSQHAFDRLRSVNPDTTQPWYQPAAQPAVQANGAITNGENAQDCSTTNCDLPQNQMDWGSTRLTYGLWAQMWKTKLLCFDDIMSKTQAKMHLAQIVGDVLPNASRVIMNDLLYKLALYNSLSALQVGGIGPQVATNNGFSPFTYSWAGTQGGNSSITGQYGYRYFNTSADPTSKVTPLHLQSQVNPQEAIGALNNPYGSVDASLGRLQFHTDNDTLYSMIQGNPTINDRVRFNDAAAFKTGAVEYYKYGFTGVVGDYMVKTMPNLLRFNQIGPGLYQTVLPYVNSATTTGSGDAFNTAYNAAQYQLSYINHPRALMVMPFKPEAVNKMMPYMIRDYAGAWKFAVNNLGADCNGKAIDNTRLNKGLFITDFKLSVKPEHPEFLIPVFHLREQPAVYGVTTTNPSPGYPAQNYSSTPTYCPFVLQWVPVIDTANNLYTIPANSTRVNGNNTTHAQITGATLATLVTNLNANVFLGTFGTWAVDPTGTLLQLTEPVGATNVLDVFFQQN